MTIDLEDRLRSELAADAKRAQLVAPEWNDVCLVPVGRTVPRRRLSRSLSAAAALVLVIGCAVAIASRQHHESPAAAFTPTGTEAPLVEIPLSEIPLAELPTAQFYADHFYVAKPGSVHVIRTEGVEGWLMTFDTIDYASFTGTVHPWRCSYSTTATACLPVEMMISVGSPHGEYDEWVNVPDGTAFVGYDDGAGFARWQRPIGGMSLVPRIQTNGYNGDFTAYAEDGRVLATINFATAGAGVNLFDGPITSLTLAQSEELYQMTRELTRACIEKAGATFPYGPVFPVMPAGADPDAWDGCVAETKSAVDAKFAEWDGQLLPQVVPSATNTGPESTALGT